MFEQKELSVEVQCESLEHRQLALGLWVVALLVVGLARRGADQGRGYESLELDGIGARLGGDVDHREGALQIAVVVHAGLGDDVDGVFLGAHQSASTKCLISNCRGSVIARSASAMHRLALPSP